MIGQLLRSIRAGDRHLAWNEPGFRDVPASIVLSSSAFSEASPMPRRYAGSGIGDNVSPPLSWSNVPPGAVELILILQDPDAPLPRPVTHLVAAIPASCNGIDEGALTIGNDRTIVLGRASFHRIGYAGPRPPRGHGPHRYIFQIYALSERLDGAAVLDLGSATAAIAKSSIARGRLTGTFERL